MEILKTNQEQLLVESTIIAAVSGAIIYFLIIPTNNYHFQQVVLSFYNNGTTDFSTDVTRLVRGLAVVALAAMVFGLLVGTAIGLGPAQALLEAGKGETLETKFEEGQIVQNTRIDVALLKSGLISGIATEDGVKFELTDKGRRFMQEYEKLERELQQKAPASSRV
jgi:hypothetical protein